MSEHDIRNYYEQYPSTNPAHRIARIEGAALADAAARFISGRMLEVGCGTKAKSAALVASHCHEHIGLEHDACLHDISRVDLFATAYSIPAPDNLFDSVLCTAVLEHLEEPSRALVEAFRVLKPAGHAVYTMPLYWHLHEEPRDFYRYTRHGLRYLFENAGFEVVEIQALSGFLTTFSAELGYFIQRYRKGPLAFVVDALVILLNLVPLLDRGILRDERFSWAYLVVARKQPKH